MVICGSNYRLMRQRLKRLWHKGNLFCGRALRSFGRALAKAGKGMWWVFSDAGRAKTLWRILLFFLALLSAFGVISLDAHWYQLFNFGADAGKYVPFLWRVP